MQKKILLFGIVAMLAVAAACGGDKKNPVSPTSSGGAATDAGADGSTLKVSAPAPISPSNATTDSRKPTLVARHATGTFVVVTSLTYRYHVVNAQGSEIYNVGSIPAGSADRSSHAITTELAYATDYRWRARAEQGDLFGPWSGYALFRTPNEPLPPTLVSPASGSILTSFTPALVITNPKVPLPGTGTTVYRFVVETAAGAGVVNTTTAAGVTTTTYTLPTGRLQAETAYRWRTRAELGSTIGLWSPYWTFSTPKEAGSLASYQNSTELWDNLADGRTIGNPVNAIFLPGRGVQLPDFSSHVSYTLGSTLTAGEMSFLIENIDEDTNGSKTKVVTMQQGYDDFTANKYRFNLEKRGDDHVNSGLFRIRIITGDPETFYDSDRFPAPLKRSKLYFFRITWGSGVVTFKAHETSENGPIVAQYTMSYQGTYRPSPHVVHLGVPTPRGGELDATVPGIIIRYFYVSAPGGRRPGSTSSFLPDFGFDRPGLF